MSKLRSVSTAFWSDPFIEDLNPAQKLLFLYLITNEKTNMLGIYEASIKKISFETGVKESEITTFFNLCEQRGKLKYVGNYVILINFVKNQNYNTNMKKSAIDVYNKLPNELKKNGLELDRVNPLEAFETLSNCLGTVRKYEVEVEAKYEYEEETETKVPFVSFLTFDEFWELYNKKVGKEKASNKYAKISEADRLQIKKSLPNYLAKITDKKYQKDPLTYLNGKHWQDEYEIETQYDPEQETMPAIITRTSGGGVSIDFSNYGRPVRK